jgi:hypothetical protein
MSQPHGASVDRSLERQVSELTGRLAATQGQLRDSQQWRTSIVQGLHSVLPAVNVRLGCGSVTRY